MDPITAAGIGLSVTSLAFQLLSGCVKGYQIMLDVADMPAKFEYIRVRMRLEQSRLLNWGDKVGLLEDILDEPSLAMQLHRNLIFDVLVEISRLFKACVKVETTFAALSPPSSSSAVTRTNSSVKVLVSAKPKRTELLLAKALNLAQKSTDLPKRLQWAMVKQDKFERLVEQLISYNDSITSILDGSSLQQIHQMQVQSQLSLLQLSAKIDELTQLTQALQIKPAETESTALVQQTRQRTLPPSGSKISVGSGNTLGLDRLAAFKANSLGLELGSSPVKEVLINKSEVHILESRGGIDTALLRGQKVWVEWKDSDLLNPNPWWKNVVDVRVKKLASLLSLQDTPPEFRAPECLGYFEEFEDDATLRYGFVNRLPLNASTSATPKSLLYLTKYEQPPSLTKRIEMAAAVASSLMYLHSVNWLHKNIRSENVVFFPEANDMINYASPIITGFEYARPDLPSEITEKPRTILEHDIYRHPYSLKDPQARSQKSWDIYSLGIVLIEIAFWKTVGEISGIDFRHVTAKSKVRRVRGLLLQDQFLERVAVQCGDRYTEVVRRCIAGGADIGAEGEADESDPNVGVEIMQAFSRDIVGVLQEIQI